MPSKSGKVFVVQKHTAEKRGLHYDFRLQDEKLLRSWAITGHNAPPTKAARISMIRVEDHPLDWAEFEGNIPHGEYGAGTVEIWDKGTFTFRNSPTEKKWSITLSGTKLQGDYSVLQVRDKIYYLIKKKAST
ncbi:MAG TPA: DNA polymerase ligase N-terminal domain-containing protein [Candidatus Deferrimicrobium sp.]|nr:DNA polymerase ligase N-terminal domain-containing protein [Candidatus Deferrimicrobium sp.]